MLSFTNTTRTREFEPTIFTSMIHEGALRTKFEEIEFLPLFGRRVIDRTFFQGVSYFRFFITCTDTTRAKRP